MSDGKRPQALRLALSVLRERPPTPATNPAERPAWTPDLRQNRPPLACQEPVVWQSDPPAQPGRLSTVILGVPQLFGTSRDTEPGASLWSSG